MKCCYAAILTARAAEYRVLRRLFGDKICGIRQCAMAKECETCGSCAEMMTCGKLGAIIKNNEEALHNLKK